MGLYLTHCSQCNTVFQWFSGCDHQLCPECSKGFERKIKPRPPEGSLQCEQAVLTKISEYKSINNSQQAVSINKQSDYNTLKIELEETKRKLKKLEHKYAATSLAYSLVMHMNEFVKSQEFKSAGFEQMISTRWIPGIKILKQQDKEWESVK